MSPRRWKILTTIGVTAVLFGGGLGIASAADDESPGTISCPVVDVASLGAVPESARAEVERNLALLNTQIAEANNRLANSVGQGGAAFVQNAILGPLSGKRTAAINRIATAIGRQGVRPTLDVATLSGCVVADGGAAQPAIVPPADGAEAPPADGEEAPPADDEQAPPADGAAVGTISCPSLDFTDLGAVPASALAEVERNLALLDTQIAEANNRLANSVGQGGAAFVQNAILGPLAGKRTSAINRIATAIGRQGLRPNLPVAALSECSVA